MKEGFYLHKEAAGKILTVFHDVRHQIFPKIMRTKTGKQPGDDAAYGKQRYIKSYRTAAGEKKCCQKLSGIVGKCPKNTGQVNTVSGKKPV